MIRDTYDELVEAKMEKKRAERDALKQKLIIIIVVLIVITSGNVWFIWYRWQSAREQEWDQRMKNYRYFHWNIGLGSRGTCGCKSTLNQSRKE